MADKKVTGATETTSTNGAPVHVATSALRQVVVPMSNQTTESNARGAKAISSVSGEGQKLSTGYEVSENEAGELIIVERTIRPDVELHYDDNVSYLVMIRPDDYLGKIALREYNNPAKWHSIYQWNKAQIGDDPNVLYPYQELELFKPKREITDMGDIYIIHPVAKGETLWSIAKDWYGDNLAWATIYADNEQLLISSEGRLLRGMELKIRTNLIKLHIEELRVSSTGKL